MNKEFDSYGWNIIQGIQNSFIDPYHDHIRNVGYLVYHNERWEVSILDGASLFHMFWEVYNEYWDRSGNEYIHVQMDGSR